MKKLILCAFTMVGFLFAFGQRTIAVKAGLNLSNAKSLAAHPTVRLAYHAGVPCTSQSTQNCFFNQKFSIPAKDFDSGRPTLRTKVPYVLTIFRCRCV
jgi:hypothetical protein